MPGLISLLLGVMFGVGLLLSGMTNPAKVQAFLDITGQWDFSLALVMGAAVAAAFIPFQWSKRQKKSLLGLPLNLPTSRQIDWKLLLGSALFGVGWGIAGICPGPAVVIVGAGEARIFWFFIPMLITIAGFQFWQSYSASSRHQTGDL